MKPRTSKASALFFTLVAVVVPVLADDPAPVVLSFSELLPEYSSFDQIRTVVTNVGEAPIFLPSYHPRLKAYLHRWNDETETWEGGRTLRICWTVVDREKPIRLAPGESETLSVDREVSVDDSGHEVDLRAGDEGMLRLASGRYRLVTWYALEPWAWGYSLNPESRRPAVSGSFEVIASP